MNKLSILLPLELKGELPARLVHDRREDRPLQVQTRLFLSLALS